ncbi:MAG: winged helix-turn-helix transcriptional regulator [Armatimonadetes bacterium]|nr:winged helix-turn-helix transcriptional regulator [Armatimonadota bacterium]
MSQQSPGATWSFVTNHTAVLVCLAQDSGMRLRDVAEKIGITERAVQRIVADLEEAHVLSRQKSGRRNVYTLDTSIPLRHPLLRDKSVGDLLAALTK